ncbi:MAG TPA: YkgJ family cysteine cluster protein [Terriglobales bacterium]|nr:YkgJ family cysteine cluster protein [Terriglobales bacterium]
MQTARKSRKIGPLSLPTGDRQLIQIVDAALADAVQRSGHWLACRPGCTQCCIGPFPISQLDAARLQTGLAELDRADPARAARVHSRAREFVARLSPMFPGDPATGLLNDDQSAFDDFANDEPCPALDPTTGTCDLYAHRPMTCREFGPPVRIEDEGSNAFSVCELCFQGASPEEVAACEFVPDPDGIESELIAELEDCGHGGQTIVAFAIAKP